MFHPARFFLSSSLKKPLIAGLVAGALWAPLAHADDYAEVNRLVRAGQTAEALGKVDQYLANKPRDPQMRFLKGVILAESGKPSEAVAVFTKLTEDYPELPEPYNNLAVLHAGQSQFDKARVALEMAIRTNPSYATAHENLGDVYAKLASQSYSKALQLDSTNTGVPTKLALIRNLFSPDARSTGKPLSVSTSTTTPAAPAAAVTKSSATPAPVAPPAAAAPAVAAAPTKVAPPAATADAATADIEEAVRNWAKAWAAKDMASYLDAYSKQFNPTGAKSRKDWEKERHSRITTKASIAVVVSDFDVEVTGNQATVTFKQHYRSGSLDSRSRKTLTLLQEKGRWLITRESAG